MKLTSEEMTHWVIERLEVVLDRTVSLDDLNQSFDCLGADSIDMVVLASDLEEILVYQIEPEIFLRIDTIKGALEEIYKNASEL